MNSLILIVVSTIIGGSLGMAISYGVAKIFGVNFRRIDFGGFSTGEEVVMFGTILGIISGFSYSLGKL